MQKVLSQIEDENLAVFLVWIPAIRTDNFEASLQSRNLVPDQRVKHFYDESQALGNALAPVLGTRMRMAWDVYVAYPKSESWEGAPPKPADWLHQKSGEEPKRYLEEEKLKALLDSLLE